MAVHCKISEIAPRRCTMSICMYCRITTRFLFMRHWRRESLLILAGRRCWPFIAAPGFGSSYTQFYKLSDMHDLLLWVSSKIARSETAGFYISYSFWSVESPAELFNDSAQLISASVPSHSSYNSLHLLLSQIEVLLHQVSIDEVATGAALHPLISERPPIRVIETAHSLHNLLHCILHGKFNCSGLYWL